METYLSMFALGMTAAGAVTDIQRSRIPNWLTYSGLLLALAARVALLGLPGLRDGLAGAAVGGALFFVLFLIGGMGGGDVKMMTAVGAWLGASQAFTVLIATAIAGGFLGLGYMLFRRQTFLTLINTFELVRHHLTTGLQQHPTLNIRAERSVRVPFGVAIAFGTWYSVGTALWWR